MDHLKLTVDKLSVDEVSDLVVDNSCGAVSLFVGTTRDNFEGKTVLRLEYEAYEPMALKAMKSICDEVRNKWPSVHGIAMYHRLGIVPIREASVIIAVSSPHRQESLSAVQYCIDTLKSSVPIWKKEVYDSNDAVWKENIECPKDMRSDRDQVIDKSLIQINVPSEELEKRIQNFIDRKREQVNLNNIYDFIPTKSDKEDEEAETCARVRTEFVRRKDSKGHLKIHKVCNEWGPQTHKIVKKEPAENSSLPTAIAERVLSIENYLNISPVPRDIYHRLKEMESRIAHLESVSPEYAQFWRQGRSTDKDEVKPEAIDYVFTADDIAKKIEQLEKEGN